MSSRVAWRVAAIVAFAVTAALAVALSRGTPLDASFVSARHHVTSGHEPAARQGPPGRPGPAGLGTAGGGEIAPGHGAAGERCAPSRLRVRASAGGRAAGHGAELASVLTAPRPAGPAAAQRQGRCQRASNRRAPRGSWS